MRSAIETWPPGGVTFEGSPAALKLGNAAELTWQHLADAATAEEAAIAALEAEFKGD